MPHRSYASTANYRFGFNGKENDNEPKGLGNQQDYGMRIYDDRIGKFLSTDPISVEYPWYTPYQFAGNKPIWAIDLDGLEEAKSTAGAISTGVKKYTNEKREEVKMAGSLFTSWEPYKNILSYAKDWGNALIGNSKAAISASKKTTNALVGITNNIVVNPSNFLGNLHKRTFNENLTELTYQSLKGTELYLSVRFFNFMEEGVGAKSAGGILPKQTDRLFTHFTSIEGVTGISGINTKILENLKVGETLIVDEVAFGVGKNNFMALQKGDIFVTPLNSNSSQKAIEGIGVFGDKQNFAISFSEEEAIINNGVKPRATNVSRGIYVIPANTALKGKIFITKLRQ